MARKSSTPRRHGRAPKTPEYLAWITIKARCLNPKTLNYHNYGGRGITMYEPWQSDFTAFLQEVGFRPTPTHTLDRIDNNGSYAPGNIRWATRTEQARNTRTNRIIAFNGTAACLAEWAEITGIKRATLHTRLRDGWPIEDTLTIPVSDRGGWEARRRHGGKP